MNVKRFVVILALVVGLLFVGSAAAFAAGQVEEEPDKLTFGYITPGPDTWYAMVVDGFTYAAERVQEETGIEIEVDVLNSNYDEEQERSNIQTLIDRGVDGMGVFSFNPHGATIAAREAARAGIPLVTVDNVGQALEEEDIVAAIDFDWEGMGVDVAEWIAENHPGDNIAVVMGLFEHLPVQFFRSTFEPTVEELGQNEIVEIRDGRYDPERAVAEVEDMIEAGIDFETLFVFNEEMGAAVVRMLDARGLLNDPIRVVTTNGAPYGLELIEEGKIKYSISTSPGWEGFIAYLTLHSYVTGMNEERNRQILLPNNPITPETIDDPMKVVPWETNPVWLDLTSEYFPEFDGLY